MQESWILFLIQFFPKKNPLSFYNMAYCKKRNRSNKLYMNRSITTRRRNNEKKSFDCDKSIFFVYIFIAWKNPRRCGSSNMQDLIHLGSAISWAQSNVGLIICQAQHTWAHESAKLKATWARWNAKSKTLRFKI
jgi:hypothetical protein